MNNKTLGLVFGALLLIYLLTKLFGGNKERSFDPEIIAIDTAAIDKVVVHPAQGEEVFNIVKTGPEWQLQRGADQYQATSGSVGGLLSNLSSIKADRIVTKNADRYSDYAVDENGGTRLELYSGSKKEGDIVVGRFNFNQATRSGISYLKKYDEDEVYSVDGFLSMSLNQSFDNYRNKMITSLNADDITRVVLSESNLNMTMTRVDSVWRNDEGTPIDSAAAAQYINTLKSISGGTFITSQSDIGDRLKSLTIEGNNMAAPMDINCYQSQDTSQHFVIHSSGNQEGYFFSDSVGIYDRIFGKFPLISQSSD